MRVENMTLYELQNEINACEQQRQIGGVGIKDLVYLDTLYLEVDRRGYTISANFNLIDEADIEGLDREQKPKEPKREVELDG